MAPSSEPTLPAELPPPPMGPGLAAAVADLGPVRTRVPGRSLVVVLLVSLITAAAAVLAAGVRPDAHALPLPWLVGVGVLWAAAGPFLLARTILPPQGSVLPDVNRASRSAAALAVGLVALGFVASIEAPGAPTAGSFLGGYWHCTKAAVRIILPVLLAGGLVLRHLAPVGAARLAAALGAAGGAWAGLVLHVICPLGDRAHVGLAHGGATALGAALGALLIGLVFRRLVR